MTCWNDPLNRNKRYALPLGTCLSLAGTSDSSLASYVFRDHSSFESYFQKTTKKKGFLGIKKSTKIEHHYLKQFYRQDMSLSISEIYNERYRLSLNAIFGLPLPDLPLHPKFIAAVNALPATYDAARYRDFVNHFGTHYIDEVSLGMLSLFDRLIEIRWTSRITGLVSSLPLVYIQG